MDAVEILNRYTVSVLQDAKLVSLLAQLFREGMQTDEYVAKQLDSDIRDIRRSLLRLYKASLIQRCGDALWAVTPLGEFVLEQLDIATITSQQLVRSLALGGLEERILDALVRRPQTTIRKASALARLRALAQIQHTEPASEENTAVSALCLLADRHSFAAHSAAASQNRWMLVLGDHDEPVVSVRDRLRALADKLVGMTLIVLSSCDSVLAQPRHNTLLSDPQIYRTTLARALAATVWGRPDPEFTLGTRDWNSEEFRHFWDVLLSQKTGATASRVLLKRWDRSYVDRAQDLASYMAAAHQSVVTRLEFRAPAPFHFGRPWFKGTVESEVLWSFASSDAGNRAVDALRTIIKDLRTEGAPRLPEHVLAELRQLVGELAMFLKAGVVDSGPKSDARDEPV